MASSNFRWSEHSKCCDSTQLDKTIDLLKDPKSSIKPIKRESFKIFREILGLGAQGKVNKGQWCNFDVAVKSIKLSSTNVKLACREIKVLEEIRHPNIIQLMAYCVKKDNYIHLLMEFFESVSLYDLLLLIKNLSKLILLLF